MDHRTAEYWIEENMTIEIRDGFHTTTGLAPGAFGIHFDDEREQSG